MNDAVRISLEPEFALGIAEIDQQHRRIVHIFNNLLASVEQSEDSEEHVARLYDEFVSYVRFHFRSEERLMAQWAYPDELAHAVAHMALMDEVMGLRERFLRGEVQPVLKALKAWVMEHIVSSDRRLADFLHAHQTARSSGLNGAAAPHQA